LACLVAGHAGRTLELLAEPTRQNWPAPWRAIAVLLVGATYRWRGQRKLAMQTITPLLDHSVEPLARTEALLLQAQLLSDTKPPRTALAAIDAARAAARQLAHPALLARCHDAAAAMLRLVGEEREARDAERAALALRRRCQADPAFDPHWPLLAVHAAAFDPPAVEVSQAVP
jgi:hypothetical protein